MQTQVRVMTARAVLRFELRSSTIYQYFKSIFQFFNLC